MDVHDLQERFHDRPHVMRSLVDAHRALEHALSVMTPIERSRLFSDDGHVTTWYTAEVIDVLAPNVIKYDESHVVLHEWPTFLINGSNVERVAAPGNIKTLARYANQHPPY